MKDIALIRVRLTEDADVLVARQRAATIASCCGLAERVTTAFATAVSEVARNAVRYATGGSAKFTLATTSRNQLVLQATISDEGPGIVPERLARIQRRKRVQSSTGLGLGLVGARRLVDQFALASTPSGTIVTLSMRLNVRDNSQSLPALALEIADQVAKSAPPDPYQELARQNRELVEALTEAREQEAAGKMLIGIVSHDLRNPMSVISMSAQMLLYDKNISDRQRKHAERALRATHRAADMITDLLDFTRASLGQGLPVERKPCPVEAVLREATGHSKAANPTVVFEVDGTECQVNGDHDRLVQAMINLIHNAIEHGVDQTPVVVFGRVCAAKCLLGVRNEIAPGTTVDEAAMFTPMNKSDASKGLGLGMYIVQEIAKAHDGECTVNVDETSVEIAFSIPLVGDP